MPCCSARPGTISALARASGTASGRPVFSTRAVPEGRPRRSAGTRRSRGCPAPEPSWLTSSTRTRSTSSSAFSAVSSAARSVVGGEACAASRARRCSGRFSSARVSVAVRRGLCLPETGSCLGDRRPSRDLEESTGRLSRRQGSRRRSLRTVRASDPAGGAWSVVALSSVGASVPPSAVPSGAVCGCVSGVVPDASGAGGGLRVVGVRGSRWAWGSRSPSTRARGLRRYRARSSWAGSPGTSWTATVAPPQPARAKTSMVTGTASRGGARRMRPPLSGAARPSGGRTSGSR